MCGAFFRGLVHEEVMLLLLVLSAALASRAAGVVVASVELAAKVAV